MENLTIMLDALIFSALGIVIFWVSLFVIEKATPYSIQKEIVEKQNMAMAVIIGSLAIGISIIIGFAHG